MLFPDVIHVGRNWRDLESLQHAPQFVFFVSARDDEERPLRAPVADVRAAILLVAASNAASHVALENGTPHERHGRHTVEIDQRDGRCEIRPLLNERIRLESSSEYDR